MVPMSINRRIQRVMHFPIPLRSFEATVRLPPETDVRVPMQSSKSVSRYLHHKSVSPRSIPVSPRSRKRVQLAFSNFSDEVLYQARDRLRRERAVTLTGDGDLRIPRFNAQDCDEDIRLSCGQNCAVKVCFTAVSFVAYVDPFCLLDVLLLGRSARECIVESEEPCQYGGIDLCTSRCRCGNSTRSCGTLKPQVGALPTMH